SGDGGVRRVARVDPVAKFLARLEVRDILSGQGHGLAGLGVAAQARRAEVQREAAKTADLDAFTLGQRAAHHLEQGLDGQVHVVGLEMRLAPRQHLDQFGLGHLRAIPRSSWVAAWPGNPRATRRYINVACYSPLLSCSR